MLPHPHQYFAVPALLALFFFFFFFFFFSLATHWEQTFSETIASSRKNHFHYHSFTFVSRYRFLYHVASWDLHTSYHSRFDSSSLFGRYTESRPLLSHRIKQNGSLCVSIYHSQSFAFVYRYRFSKNCVIRLQVEIVAHHHITHILTWVGYISYLHQISIRNL